MEIAAQVSKAIEDGYKTSLSREIVEEWLKKIQAGVEPPGVMEDGEVVVNCLGLGVSGTLPEDKRPDLKLTKNCLRNGELGAIYVTEGANRLSRDPDRIVSAQLLKLMKETNCKLRTPLEILSPCIQRDWDIIHDELERGAEELRSMNNRLYRRRALKAARGEFVGEPIPPGFIVPIIENRSNGSRIYGKYQRYAPHAEITEKILREYIRQGFSEMKTHHALNGLVYPLFPPDLQYMERLSSLRKTKKIEGIGYFISPSMVTSLVMNPKLIGWAIWGDTEPIPANHEVAVPENLWLEAYRGAVTTGKRRGRGIRHEPLEWDGLLRCRNHETWERISGHSSKDAYRCESEYARGVGPTCFEIAAKYFRPLTEAVLLQLDFTPFAEEVLTQMEAEAVHENLEEDAYRKEQALMEKRIMNLEEQLGWEDGLHDRLILKQIEKTQCRLEELKFRPIPQSTLPKSSYKAVKEFLAGLPRNWYKYSRTMRNRLLKRLIDHVDILSEGQNIEATVFWKTGQTQIVRFQRARAKGNRESHWTEEELGTLKELWPAASQVEIRCALPERTWSAIAHQAFSMGLKRARVSSHRVEKRRWKVEDEREGRRLYEAGVSIQDIASKLGRNPGAVTQKAWQKKWRRLDEPKGSLMGIRETKKKSRVLKGITSGRGPGG
jgi:hypothetical protein